MSINKKKILFGVIILFFIVCITIIVIIVENKNNNYTLENSKKQITTNNFLTLMLEQSDGTYQESISNTWPGDGYIFNKELSSCQNGGELDYDSENNKVILYNNKSDGCYIYFDLYNKPIINSINLGEVTNNSITISVSAANGTNTISNYYYIINDETPVSTTSNTYTFSGLNSGVTYTIKVYVVDTEGYSSEVSNLNVETENGILFANYIKNSVYQDDGVNGLYYHDGQGVYGYLEAEDNSYRYSGSNPNNYVCFGSDNVTCPEDNLYRIIGVFDNEVKLIKASHVVNDLLGTDGTFAGDNYGGPYRFAWFHWNTETNQWSETSLNKINLNTNFINNIGNEWSNLISNHIWQVGGGTSTNLIRSNAKTTYNYEVGINSINIIYTAKVGLMYVSDYYYAATPDYWTYPGYSSSGSNNDYRAATDSDWMYLGDREWTISRDTGSNYNAFYVWWYVVSDRGDLDDMYSLYIARPAFYLNSSVIYISGDGSQNNPFRIA